MTGVWYDAGAKRWAVFNQNMARLPAGAAFNVQAMSASDSVWTYAGSGNNVAKNSTRLDHPLVNGRPQALFQVTPKLEPPRGRRPLQ